MSLVQSLGQEPHPVAHSAKKLHKTAAGWLLCLRATAATAVLTDKAIKVDLGMQTRSSDMPSCQSYSRDKRLLVVNRGTAYYYQAMLLDTHQGYYKNLYYY